MKSNQINTKKSEKSLYNITVKGSLGLLALGDVGLREWRNVKKESFKKDAE